MHLIDLLATESLRKLDEETANTILAISLPPFFHGTDARIVDMSISERHIFHTECKNVCSFLWKFYSTIYDCDAFVSKYFSENNKQFGEQLLLKLSDWNCAINNSTMHRYESKGIYLTTVPRKAQNYAYRARYFGELGSIAYYMIKGLDFFSSLNLDFSESIKKNMSKITGFGEDKAKPVIYLVDNICPKFLYNAFCTPRKKVDLESIKYIQDVYYEDEIILAKEKAIYLKESRF